MVAKHCVQQATFLTSIRSKFQIKISDQEKNWFKRSLLEITYIQEELCNMNKRSDIKNLNIIYCNFWDMDSKQRSRHNNERLLHLFVSELVSESLSHRFFGRLITYFYNKFLFFFLISSWKKNIVYFLASINCHSLCLLYLFWKLKISEVLKIQEIMLFSLLHSFKSNH